MDESRRRSAPIATLLLIGATAISTATLAQPAPSAGDVAASFAKAVVARDWAAAAPYHTEASRRQPVRDSVLAGDNSGIWAFTNASNVAPGTAGSGPSM